MIHCYGVISMTHYHVKEPIQDKMIIDQGEDVFHIGVLRRLTRGDHVVVVHQGARALMTIDALDDKKITLSKVRDLSRRDKPFHVTLAASLIRRDRFEILCETVFSLGADVIVPLKSTYSRPLAAHADSVNAHPEAFWRRAAFPARPLESLKLEDYDYVFLLSEHEKSHTIKRALEEAKPNGSFLLIVGPERGFTQEEVEALVRRGATSVTIGSDALRSDSASIMALSMLRYRFMEA